MGRKLKLEYITNDAARKATFNKRKKGLLKKVGELSTLCAIDACAVITSPYEAAPEVYPSTLEAQRLLARFRSLPESDQNKKMLNQEELLRQQITKATEQLGQLKKENREKELTLLMLQGLATAGGGNGDGVGSARVLNGLNINDINELGLLVEQNLKDVAKKIEKVRAGKTEREVENNERALIFVPLPPGPVAGHSGETSGEGRHAVPPEVRGIQLARVRRQLSPTPTAPLAPQRAR